jgi:hypothetical protein
MNTPAPGVEALGGVVARFDEAADAALETLRANPVLSRVMPLATDAGEFSAIWHVCSLVRGLTRRRPDQVLALAIGIGLESLLVNQGIKRLFRRERPTTGGDQRFEIRTPLTSSFPSGHASAAAFAATVLIGWDGKRWAPLWATIAATVAISRPFVRIHHASDVVGGVAVGLTLGLAARRVFTCLGLDRR